MELRQIRMLRALGDLGSVTAVATAMHLTPSAVSQQLRQFQRGLPVPLTRRDGRRLVLTEAGERIAAAATTVETALAQADEAARSLTEEPQGTVTVSGFTSAALAFFPPLLRAFPPGRPVSVSVTDEDASQSELPRLTGRHDIVLAHRFPHTPPWPERVHVLQLLDEPLDVALPAGHRLAQAHTVSAAEVAREPWIATHEGWPVGAIVEALAAVSGHPVTVRHRVNEFSVVTALVEAGAGVALLPRWTSPAPAGVVLRPLVGVRAARHVDALTRPEHAVRPAVRAVLAELTQIAGRLVSPPAGG